MKTTILSVAAVHSVNSLAAGYLAGAVIALLIFGYLLYTLLKPEKF